MTPENLILLNAVIRTYYRHSNVTAVNGYKYHNLESVIHELSHAAVFGMTPPKNVHYEVSKRFHAYRNPKAADESECVALAVQLNVCRRLRLPLPIARAVPYACKGMQTILYMDVAYTHARVRQHLSAPRTRIRAQTVMGWLEPAIRDVSQMTQVASKEPQRIEPYVENVGKNAVEAAGMADARHEWTVVETPG